VKTPNDSIRFLKLSPYADILSKIDSHFGSYVPKIETVQVDLALGTISAEDVTSKVDIPPGAISAMDGYAVRSADLKSASPSKPKFFKTRGSIYPGHSKLPSLHQGETYYVATGAPIPRGTDMVVRVEEAAIHRSNSIIVRHVIEKGKDIAEKGEDIRRGQIVVRKGQVLNPTDVALLIGIGRTRIKIFKIPKVGLLSIGNELREFNPTRKPWRADARTINNYLNLLSGYLGQLGSKPISLGICRDNLLEIQRAIIRGLKECDMILTISGSSVGRHDNDLDALRGIRGSKFLFHGVRVVPIKPSGVVLVRGKPVVIIPGHAVSALLTFFTIALPILNIISGLPAQSRKVMMNVEVKSDITNERPIEALSLVRLEADGGKYCAIPLSWGSNLVSNLSRADGFVWLSKNQTIPRKQMARVQLFTGNPIAKSP
jgi:molybdopterin molybdotransferase